MPADKYLKDRRTGDLYGWNYEMAKFPYMKEVERGEDGWDDGKPDPTYVDPEAPKPTSDVFPQAGTSSEMEEDRARVEREALERAANKGRAELDEPVEGSELYGGKDADGNGVPDGGPVPQENAAPPYDDNGCMLLGYDEDDLPVYETVEERDERINTEANAHPHVESEQPPGPAPEVDGVVEEPAKTEKKGKKRS